MNRIFNSRIFKSRGFMVGGVLGAAWLAFVFKCRMQSTGIKPDIHPKGDPKGFGWRYLETGSMILQRHDPVKDFNTYFIGFHPVKGHPTHQMEAHHYCKQVNEDFTQCLIYDANTRDANLTGIEYIISEKLYKDLPVDEREYWHPHNYEILSGQLVGPGLPQHSENAVLAKMMNSYGKTIHTWRAKCWEDKMPYLDTLPLGESYLAWSFNHDGEAKPEMVDKRDKLMNVSTEQKRKAREKLQPLAHRQDGVNDKDKLPPLGKQTGPMCNHSTGKDIKSSSGDQGSKGDKSGKM